MATPFNNGDILECLVASMCGNQIGLNRYFWKINVATPSSGTTVENFGTVWDTLFSATYVNWLAVDAVYYGLSWRVISPVPTQSFTLVNQQPGVVVGNTSPKQASGIIFRKSAVAGKKGRGRVYIPFVPAGAIDPTGEINAGGVVLLNAIRTAFLTPQLGVGFPGPGQVDFSPQLVEVGPPVVFADVTQAGGRARVATQKRRGDYGKLNTPPW